MNPMKLEVGDKVRLVKIDETGLQEDTKEILNFLIKSNFVLTVAYLEEIGIPWVEFEKEDENGTTQHHSLSLHFDQWEKVE